MYQRTKVCTTLGEKKWYGGESKASQPSNHLRGSMKNNSRQVLSGLNRRCETARQRFRTLARSALVLRSAATPAHLLARAVSHNWGRRGSPDRTPPSYSEYTLKQNHKLVVLLFFFSTVVHTLVRWYKYSTVPGTYIYTYFSSLSIDSPQVTGSESCGILASTTPSTIVVPVPVQLVPASRVLAELITRLVGRRTICFLWPVTILFWPFSL
jgi:hypothetical protein